jgi:membrane fusion protein (multidrug efflux system)
MKKLRVPLIILVVVIALALLKNFVVDAGKNKAAGAQNKGGQVPSPVTVAIVKPAMVQNNILITGDVIANEEVELRAEMSGKIVSINFTEGTTVHKGQLLVKINDADLQANLRKLTAQLKISQEKESRLEKLLKINGVSQEDYDIAQNSTQSLNSDIDYTKAQIAKTEIYAPFDGVVGLKSVSNGSYVTSANVIATIQQLNPVKIDFSVPERYAPLINKGTEVKFSTRSDNVERVAKILAIEPKIDPLTRTLRIRAVYPNADGKVLPGSFAEVKLDLQDDVASVLVPTQALIPGIRGQKAFIVKGGKAKLVDVVTGVRNDSTIQVIKGLNEGDSLVITGVMVLRDDVPVKIIKSGK